MRRIAKFTTKSDNIMTSITKEKLPSYRPSLTKPLIALLQTLLIEYRENNILVGEESKLVSNGILTLAKELVKAEHSVGASYVPVNEENRIRRPRVEYRVENKFGFTESDIGGLHGGLHGITASKADSEFKELQLEKIKAMSEEERKELDRRLAKEMGF